MKCVQNCSSNQLVLANDLNQNFCRDKTFFVNPDSREVIELGTKSYPYKSLTLALLDVYYWVLGQEEV